MCKVRIAIIPIFQMRRLWLRKVNSLLMIMLLGQVLSQDSNPGMPDLNTKLLASVGTQSFRLKLIPAESSQMISTIPRYN